ncbi:MAG: acetate--CoA ligase family protein [Deltaproteobacteria bacterium]|nr:acetate--CoA ligase family protein [Deltaproteobacteria bacterium]
MATNIDYLFNPDSVALIGASNDPLKWGNWMAKRVIESDYKGDLYLINAKGGIVCGRETVKKISDIADAVDIAIIGIPARFVPDTVKDCVAKGVKGIIIVTAGFGETGEAGRDVERKLLETVRKGGARIVGQNCLGIYNASAGLNTTVIELPKGFFGFLSQSGNFALDLNYNVKKRGFGYSKWASYGNQIDISTYEYLDYLKEDPETKVILLYIEGLYKGTEMAGREFLKVAKAASKKKPLVAIKIGTSSAGIRSAASHTGSIAGSNEIYDAAFIQAGIIRVDNSSDLLDVGEALGKCPLPGGNRVAILTDGGGHGTMACDAAEKYGLSVPVLSTETQEKLTEILPPQASTKNPVDFAGGAEADLWNFVRCSEILIRDDGIDALVIVGQYGGYGIVVAEELIDLEEKVAVALAQLVGQYGKPVINHTMFEPDKPKALQILSQNGIPVYPVVEKAMRCMGALAQYKAFLDKMAQQENEAPLDLPSDRISNVENIIKIATGDGRRNLLETEARDILKAYGIPMSDYELAESEQEAVRIADEMGYPVAMKIVSPDILHKSDAGGVKLNIKNKDEIVKGYSEIIDNADLYNKEAKIHGIMITPMEEEGVETIIGMTTNETFGPTIMFGLGGIFVEVLKDVCFKVAPLSRIDAWEMVRQIKGFPILTGVRGQKRRDIDAITDTIMKVSALAIENPQIGEIDLNPVFAFEDGVSVVDARMILR